MTAAQNNELAYGNNKVYYLNHATDLEFKRFITQDENNADTTDNHSFLHRYFRVLDYRDSHRIEFRA